MDATDKELAEEAAEEAAAVADSSSSAEDAFDDAASLATASLAQAVADAADKVVSMKTGQPARHAHRRLLMSTDCPRDRFLLVRGVCWSSRGVCNGVWGRRHIAPRYAPNMKEGVRSKQDDLSRPVSGECVGVRERAVCSWISLGPGASH